MTKIRFYEPARLGTPPESSFSLNLLDTNLVGVIVNRRLPYVKAMSIIDLFTDTAAILNEFDLRSIIGCPGGMSTFCLYFRALFGTFCLNFSWNKTVMGKKILVPCFDVIMIAFF